MLQHRHTVGVRKTDVFKRYLTLKAHRLRPHGFGNRRRRSQHRVYALQRSQTAADAIGSLTQVLGGVDDRIEDHQIVDERRRIDRGMVAQYQQTTEPQDDGYQGRTQELRQRMCQIVTTVDTVECRTGSVDQHLKAVPQLVLCIKALHHTQSQQCLVDSRQYFGVLFLPTGGSVLERAAYLTDHKNRYRHQYQHKQRQLPRDDQHRRQIDQDHHRILKQYIQGRHDRHLHLVDIVGHTRDDITSSGLGERAHRQRQDLVIQLLSEIAQHTCADGDHKVISQPCRAALQARHHY